MQSRLSSIDTFGATQLPHHLPSVYNAAIRSLIAERELFAIVAPLLGEIGVAEAGPIGMLPDISALTASWVSVTNTLQSWRTQRESPRGTFSPSRCFPPSLFLSPFLFSLSLSEPADTWKVWYCLTASLSRSRSLCASRVSPLIFHHPSIRIFDPAIVYALASR